MRLYELLAEAAPAIPMQYINPPAEQMAGGKVVSLTPQQVQIIVKANKLTSTAASSPGVASIVCVGACITEILLGVVDMAASMSPPLTTCQPEPTC